MNKIPTSNIPQEVRIVSDQLEKAGFESFLVGGCVRDLMIGLIPKDWDITTNATPEQIQGVFPDSFYENNFGTVGVKTGSENNSLSIIEITPYRIEGKYSDKRRPDSVSFSTKIEDDLKRRDFTINALAFNIHKGQIIDLYEGIKDIEKKTIRCVGNPDDRFNEDALRMIRAIRISSEIGFIIESETANAIIRNSKHLADVSRERIGEEFKRIIMSKNPMQSLFMAQKMDVLSYFSHFFVQMVDVSQNKEAHKYDVWEHSLRTLQHAADKGFSLETRLAALFHDIGKPISKRVTGNKTTFYGHDVVGERVSRETLADLKFDKDTIEKVAKLVRWHMFFSDTEEITPSAVRRLIRNVGKENIWDLVDLRICDRVGTGRPKEQPYRLRKYQSMIDEVLRDPISVSMLKVNGNTLIDKFHVEPGPKIGWVLNALLEEVIEDPNKNTETFLLNLVDELLKMPEHELRKRGEAGKDATKKADEEIIKDIRGKHRVS